jgi:hypothetical protein
MMPRRLLACCALLAVSAAVRADPPPWETQPAATPSGTSAPTPEASAASADDALARLGDLAPILIPDEEQRAAFLRMKPDKQAIQMRKNWDASPEWHKARIRYAIANLKEGNALATVRAAVFVLAPPSMMYFEPAHDWTGETVARVDGIAAVEAQLGASPPLAEKFTLTGKLPTYAWVYPAKSVSDVRVIWFVDDDGDGTFRFVRDETVPASSRVFTTAGVEPPGNLFPAVGEGATFEDLPVVAKGGLPLKLRSDFFKAGQARTYARFTLLVDPDDVDLELGAEPGAFAAAATAWLRVAQDGKPVWQGKHPVKDAGSDKPWMLEFSAPLPPGSYEITAVAVDDKLMGGTATFPVEIPSYSGSLAISTPVIVKATEDGKLTAAGAPAADGSLAPFQVGNYIARPDIAATFKRGEWLALVVQVYNAPTAVIEYDLYRDGVYQSSLDPVKITTLPSTQILPQEITADFTDASYELRITVKDPSNPTSKLTATAPFRVRS